MSTSILQANPKSSLTHPVEQPNVAALTYWLANAKTEISRWTTPLVNECLEKVRVARAILSAMKAAEEIRVEACRIEMMCLKRLIDLGEKDLVPRSYRTMAAQVFESMSAEEFGRFLSWIDRDAGPCSILSSYKAVLWEHEVVKTIAKGKPHSLPCESDTQHFYEAEQERVTEASAVLLDSFKHSPFTIDEGVHKLARHLQLDLDEPTYQGLSLMIRHAIHLENVTKKITIDGKEVDVPEFVTYYEEATCSWLRLPWRLAGIEQLKFMVDFRLKQARDLLAAAENLELLWVKLRQAQENSGSEEVRLPQLLSALESE